jgi:hypothetical protein
MNLPNPIPKKRIPTTLPRGGKPEKEAELPSQGNTATAKAGTQAPRVGSKRLPDIPKAKEASEVKRVGETVNEEKPKEVSVATKPKTQKAPRPPKEVRSTKSSEEAEKPAVPTRKPAEASRPRFAYQREDVEEREGQITLVAMRALTFAARHELWRTLQVPSEDRFVTILKPSEVPRRIAREEPPGAAPNKEAIFCPYCGEWQKFRVYSFTGYTCCVGCGMSTRDFYTCNANKLWHKEM